MRLTATDSSITIEPDTEVAPAEDRDADNLPRNFIVIALHQIVVRIGWIFKTESIIMPAFLDFIGGSDALRGCLPLLSRFGFSVPPVLFARRLKIMPRKKWAVVAGTLSMGLLFGALSVVWFSGLWMASSGAAQPWMPWLFLAIYGAFFAVTGMNQLSVQAMQGKLIPATLRGRLFAVSVGVGAPLAVIAACLLLGPWLAEPQRGFGFIFGATAIAFVAAAVIIGAIRESPDNHQQEGHTIGEAFASAWRLLLDDPDCRRLAIVAALYGTVLVLFPHYQAMGRRRLGLELDNLMVWVAVQNVATAVFGLLAGPIADRSGNRLALRFCIFGAASAPIIALLLGQLGEQGGRLFWLVFLPIGLTPLTIKFLMNYALEISAAADHPRYVSTVGLCLALPVMILAPLVGALIHALGFETIFAAGAAVIAFGGCYTFFLREPRHDRPM